MQEHLGGVFRPLILFGLMLVLSLWSRADDSSVARDDRAQAGVAEQEQQLPDQTQQLAELAKQITGKENEPSGRVFKNVQILKEVPAGRLLKIMELGYSKSLGVNCTHCHVVGQWEKDEKTTKQVARDMIKMVGRINGELLREIKNLKSANPIVNCTTCHRGQVKPALNLP